MTAAIVPPAGDLPAGASGFFVPVSCPCCGEAVSVVASGVAHSTEASVLVRCTGCATEWHVLVRLLSVPKPASARRSRARAMAGSQR